MDESFGRERTGFEIRVVLCRRPATAVDQMMDHGGGHYSIAAALFDQRNDLRAVELLHEVQAMATAVFVG